MSNIRGFGPKCDLETSESCAKTESKVDFQLFVGSSNPLRRLDGVRAKSLFQLTKRFARRIEERAPRAQNGGGRRIHSACHYAPTPAPNGHVSVLCRASNQRATLASNIHQSVSYKIFLIKIQDSCVGALLLRSQASCGLGRSGS